MVGVKHITHVQRLDLLGGRLFAVDEIQKVGRLPHRRIRRKQAFALTMAVKVSRDHGNAGDEAQGLQTIFVHRIVVRFRIKTTERGDGRADDVHGQRVRSIDRVGVGEHEDLASCMLHREVQRRRLATPRFLAQHEHPGVNPGIAVSAGSFNIQMAVPVPPNLM